MESNSLTDFVNMAGNGSKLDPEILFDDDNDITKANLTAKECHLFATSDALQQYFKEPDKVNVLDTYKQQRRMYSRANKGYAIEKYVQVLAERLRVQDNKTKIVTTTLDDDIGSAIV